ncbi:MAG: glycosyltransferase [Aggregatilineales bacterium]
MTLILAFITITLIVLSGILILNIFTFPRMKKNVTAEYKTPFVSILIPARNEAAVIEKTVHAHLAQNYENFELLILDDGSTDGTGTLAQKAGNHDTRLNVIQGVSLPDGWTGKNHACHILSQHATGDILIFTDADVQWQPGALEALVSQMQTTRADLFTVWSTQQTETLSERLIVPLVAFAILNYLPAIAVHHLPFSIFGAANGQCMAWRRDAYTKIGGHSVVKDNVLEDVTLARIAKQQNLRLRMADGAGLIQCRMYDNWQTVRDGFAKNILTGYGNSVPVLLLATLFHLTLFVLPWFALLIPEYRLWGILLITIGLLLRLISAVFTQQRPLDALLMPFSVLLMTRIALQAIYWHYSGGVRWKGRTITRHSPLQSVSHG